MAKAEPAVRAERDSHVVFVGTVAWAVGALVFAIRRIPYDDEWFSLTLARGTDWNHFWSALDRDLHPPWVALLDRLLGSFSATWPIYVVRVVVSALAIALTIRTIRARFRIPTLFCVVASFHPIVFMYGGAARWYPFIFLAQALRFSALFPADRDKPKRAIAFFLGATLGPAASYLDLLFAAIDSAFFFATRTEDESRLWTSAVLVLSWIAIALPIAFSPLEHQFVRLMAHHVGRGGLLKAVALWSLLGPTGEAMLPGWLSLLGLIALPGFIWGIWCWIFSQRITPLGLWIVVTIAGWMIACSSGVWHPRYSLIIWLLLSTTLGLVFSASRLGQILATAAALYLLFVTGLTLTQRFFVKNDLNEMTAFDCRALQASHNYDLIVAPYPRTRMQMARVCDLSSSPIVDVPLAHHYPLPDERFASFMTAIRRARRILFVSTPAKGSSLDLTYDQVRRRIASECAQTEDRVVGSDIHFQLKRHFGPDQTRWKYRGEAWTCPGHPQNQRMIDGRSHSAN